MRICTNCKRAYSGANTFCPHCGMTRYALGRVCNRGHSNPRDATFCGTCGSQEMSNVAPPPLIWLRLILVILAISIPALIIWIIHSHLISYFSNLLLSLKYRIMDILIPGIIFILLLFGVSLLLPKHIGKYIRKVFFSFVRFLFRIAAGFLRLLWIISSSIISSLLGKRNVNGQRRRRI